MGCSASSTLPGFPVEIPLRQKTLKNWSKEIAVDKVWIAYPSSASKCAEICNWAAANKYRVRPMGTNYSWTPLVIPNEHTPQTNEIVLDMTVSLKGVLSVDAETRQVTVLAGTLFKDLFDTLAKQNPPLALGYSVGTGDMCIGGAVMTASRGWAADCKPDNAMPECFYGSIANMVVSFTAIVSQADGTYAPRKFQRSDPEAALMLVGVGRTLVVELTLQAIPQYNMRMLSTTDASAHGDVFAPPAEDGTPLPNSFADIVDNFGRISALYIPTTDFCWTRYSYYCPQKPQDSTEITGPYNYKFQDSAPAWVTELVKALIGVPHPSLSQQLAEAVERKVLGETGPLSELTASCANAVRDLRDAVGLTQAHEDLTPFFLKFQAASMKLGNKQDKTEDLWGPSQFQLQYVNSKLGFSTLGITIALERKDMQQAAHKFIAIFDAAVEEFRQRKEYPVNMTCELRANGLDRGPNGLPSLALSPLFYDPTKPWDVAIVVDVIFLTGTPTFPQFAKRLMEQLRADAYFQTCRVVTEWSKPFACSDDGSWKNEQEMATVRSLLPQWNDAVAAFNKYDKSGLFHTRVVDWALGSGSQ